MVLSILSGVNSSCMSTIDIDGSCISTVTIGVNGSRIGSRIEDLLKFCSLLHFIICSFYRVTI